MPPQSSNQIPLLHRLVNPYDGENYGFAGCARYVMEAQDEPDYGYWFFAGLTGDVFTQHYHYTRSLWDGISGYLMAEDPAQYTAELFGRCGYAATYIPAADLRGDAGRLQQLTDWVDRGIPVITWGHRTGVYAGYEDGGQTLLYITGDSGQPQRVTLDDALQAQGLADGWIFIGAKTASRELAQLYRDAIRAIPQRFGVRTGAYCFGPQAFRAWADDIEHGRFDGRTAAGFDVWYDYTNYVCVLSTNGSCCHEFLRRARELNPEMGYLEEISALYRRTAEIWGGDDYRNDPDSLEVLGGGFNVTLEVLQDRQRRSKIAAKIRACADTMDQVEQILLTNLQAG